MTDQSARPSVAEIAALTRRLRELSRPGPTDPAELDRFLADKRALLDRIGTARDAAARPTTDRTDVGRTAGDEATHRHHVLINRSVVVGRAADEDAVWASDDRAAGPASELITSASWAIAARDAAHERGDDVAAQRFSAEAAEAIAAAQRGGVSLAELAYELDYPGGVGPMLDGSTDAAEAERASARAEVDEARMLHVHGAVDHNALAEDAVRYIDHLDPDPWADYRIYTPDEAAAALVDRGIPPDEAPEMVDRYYDSLVDGRGWSAQDQWQIDDDDLDIMTDRATADAAAASTSRPSDGVLDELHQRVQDARAADEFWQPAGSREQWRERDEPDEDGRRWELRDVTDEPSGVADAYGSTYGTGYNWWGRENDPSARLGLTDIYGCCIPAGPVLTAEAAAQALAQDGRPLDQARADVTRYLDDLSDTLDTPVHAWGLDDADLDALRGGSRSDPASADAAIPAPRPSPDAVDEHRRDQLNRWRHDDTDGPADHDVEVFEDVCLPDTHTSAGHQRTEETP